MDEIYEGQYVFVSNLYFGGEKRRISKIIKNEKDDIQTIEFDDGDLIIDFL